MTVAKSLRGMYAFAEVARSGSFQAAAESLAVTRSSVSQQVRRLESQLGVQLVTRSTRSVVLTDLGQTFAKRCIELSHLAHFAVDELRERNRSPQGTFTVTVPHALEVSVLSLLTQFCGQFPNLLPRVITNDEPLDIIVEGIDVALRVGPLEDSDLIAVLVGAVHEVVVASAEYLAQHETPETPDQLNTHRWIATGWQRRRDFVEMCGSETISHIQQRADIHVATLPSSALLARDGIGLAFLPEVYARPWLDSGELIRVVPNFHVRERKIHALHALGRHPTSKVRLFIALLKRHLRQSETFCDG